MAKKKKEELVEEVEEVVEEVEEVEEPETTEEDEYVELTMEERITNIEKRTNITFVISLFILAISLITMIVVMNGGSVKSNNTDETETKEEAQEATYDTSAFKEIKAQDIATESKNETIVVMIGRQGCGYCAVYAPVITEVAAKHNFTVRYIDFTKIVDINKRSLIDKEAYDIIVNMDAVKEFEGSGATAMEATPATLIIKNSKILYYIRGAASAEMLENALKEGGIK